MTITNNEYCYWQQNAEFSTWPCLHIKSVILTVRMAGVAGAIGTILTACCWVRIAARAMGLPPLTALTGTTVAARDFPVLMTVEVLLPDELTNRTYWNCTIMYHYIPSNKFPNFLNKPFHKIKMMFNHQLFLL